MPFDRKRDDLLAILKAGIDAARPTILFPRLFQNPDPEIHGWLSSEKRSLLTLGKAALSSAETIHGIVSFQDHFVLSPYPSSSTLTNLNFGSHPIPDRDSYEATIKLGQWLDRLPQDSYLLVVLSGGSSSLLVQPHTLIALDEKIAINKLLIRSGASIQEINTVRKHISLVKGGHLGRRIGKRKCIVLVISDVIGDDLASIGSGPFYSDPTTYADSIGILKRYGLWDDTPLSIRSVIEQGAAAKIQETPKPGSLQIPHRIVASNRIAQLAASQKAVSLGYRVLEEPHPLSCDIAEAIDLIHQRISNAEPSTACIFGGEITLRVRGKGTGGRNQHLALMMTEPLNGTSILFAAAGTDGIDGNSKAAGAWTDGETLSRGNSLENLRKAIEACDSYHYFERFQQNIFTGPTGTNVNDLYIALV